MNPATLTGEEFHDWIAHHLAYRNDWSTLLTHEHIGRTQQSVDGLIGMLDEQLQAHATDNDWTKRTKSMKTMAEARLRQCERHVSGTGGVRQLQAWKEFAHSLVEIIEDSDMAAELLVETAPFGGLTAQQWINRRREKRAEGKEAALVEGIRAGLPMGEYLVERGAK